MANKIQIRRGAKSKLPALSAGEIGLCTDTNDVYIGNGGNIRISNRRTATKVIGNSNAWYNAGDVDYLVSGTSNAATAIQNALNALPSTGGKIIILDGTYTVSTELTISKNVVFEGMGEGTQLNVSNALATASGTVAVTLRDMKITANAIQKYLYKGCDTDSIILDNVTLTMKTSGTHVSGNDTAAAFIHIGRFTASKSNISLEATSGIHTSVSSPGCYAIAETGTGLMKSEYDTFFSDCKITIKKSYGRLHIARIGLSANNCAIYLSHFKDSNNTCILANGNNKFVGGFISMSDEPLQGSQMGLLSGLLFDETIFIGVKFRSSYLYNYSVYNKPAFIGCDIKRTVGLVDSSKTILCY